ncbi:MAG: hypothetical protein WDM86_07380 [Rhizomicrobium sp.]
MQFKKLGEVLRLRRSYNYSAFSAARNWSNAELRKFSHQLPGTIVNVSAWEDKDKEGGYYRDYFSKSTEYFLTNFGTSQGQLQGAQNEFFLDLEDVPRNLDRRFDVVFNHTTLEHIYDFRTAFKNLCSLSSDMVVVVVPWLQPLHSDYGDYWRFSPQAVIKMFDENDMETIHLTWNSNRRSSVYVLAVASREPAKWKHLFPNAPIPSSSPEFRILPKVPPGSLAFT